MNKDNFPRCINSSIGDINGAAKVLEAIDFQRLCSLGLDSSVVLYMGKSGPAPWAGTFSAHYHGGISSSNRGGLVFPMPEYWDERPPLKKLEWTPQLLLTETPHGLEFDLTARLVVEYNALADFAKFIPDLIEQGYDGSNTNHQSIFWLYLRHPTKAPEKKHLLSLGPDGLYCNGDSIGDIKVFTEVDLDKFTKISR